MIHEILSELQYSQDRRGPWKLYIYRPNGSGYEIVTWFDRKVHYPGEEITLEAARQIANTAMGEKQEIRVCDGGDMLVFHAQGGKILFGENFWNEVQS